MSGTKKSGNTTETRSNYGMHNTSEPADELKSEGPQIKLMNAGNWWNTTPGTAVSDPNKNTNTHAPKVDNIRVKTWLSVTRNELALLFPHAKAGVLDELVNILNEYMEFYGINNKNKLAHFLAQSGEESKWYTSFEESLYYSADRLKAVFPSLFMPHTDKKTKAVIPRKYDPADYAGLEEETGNLVYKKKNGNTEDEDGYTYRGRGAIQITGKGNYKAAQTRYNKEFNKNENFVDHPEKLAQNRIAILTALSYFQSAVLSNVNIPDVPGKYEITDPPHKTKTEKKVTDRSIIYQVTYYVNGTSVNGLDNRTTKYKDAVRIFFHKTLK